MEKLKKDIILLLGIILAAFLLWLIPYLLNKDASAMVTVYQNGHEIGKYPLGKEQTISIPYGEDGYNYMRQCPSDQEAHPSQRRGSFHIGCRLSRRPLRQTEGG